MSEVIFCRKSGHPFVNGGGIPKESCPICKRENAATLAYYEGMEDGICRWAWWKDGIQYVGSCGHTLKEALDQVRKEKEATLQKLND